MPLIIDAATPLPFEMPYAEATAMPRAMFVARCHYAIIFRHDYADALRYDGGIGADAIGHTALRATTPISAITILIVENVSLLSIFL